MSTKAVQMRALQGDLEDATKVLTEALKVVEDAEREVSEILIEINALRRTKDDG